MNKKEYINKIEKMLIEGPYKKIKKDPTNMFISQVKCFAKTLLNQNKIEKGTYTFIAPNQASSPIFYGSPKIHKQDIPLRPIVDYRSSPTYNLAKYLSKILKSSYKNRYSLKNTEEFIENLKQYIPDKNNDEMISIDAISLFTSIPIEGALNSVNNFLKNNQDWKIDCKLLISDILEGVKICLTNAYFQFQNIYYIQENGTAMGSPISPIISEIFMQELEINIIENNTNIMFYKRYVDDCFLIIKKNKNEEILEQFNLQNKYVKFTSEKEVNKKIAYLDSLITMENNYFKTEVYRKNTNTSLYLNYKSHHHMSQKISVIDALLFRAHKICDNWSIKKEIRKIKEILTENNYPTDLITKKIKIVKKRILNQGPKENKPRIAIPYIANYTEKITRTLRRNFNLNFGYFTGTKLSTFFNTYKDKREKSIGSIYKLECKDCPLVYIGETKRKGEIRLKEHMRDIRNKKPESGPASHVVENNFKHTINNNITTLSLESRYFHRKFKESLFIEKHKPNIMNKENGIEINDYWKRILTSLLN